MTALDNKAKALNDIANELEPPEEEIQKPSKEELMNKLMLYYRFVSYRSIKRAVGGSYKTCRNNYKYI